MKKFHILILYICICTTQLFSQQKIDHVLRKYKNDNGVVNLSFTGDAIKKYTKEAKKGLKSEIQKIDILMFNEASDINSVDKAKIKDILALSKFDILMDVKHKDGKVKVYSTEIGPYITNLYAYVNADKKNIYLIASGNILMDELSLIGLNFNEKAGFDLLKKYGK
jgi:hypothetical protein